MFRMYFNYLKAFTGSKKGQGMVEYGLVIGLVALAVITILTTMGGEISRLFSDITTTLQGAKPK